MPVFSPSYLSSQSFFSSFLFCFRIQKQRILQPPPHPNTSRTAAHTRDLFRVDFTRSSHHKGVNTPVTTQKHGKSRLHQYLHPWPSQNNTLTENEPRRLFTQSYFHVRRYPPPPPPPPPVFKDNLTEVCGSNIDSSTVTVLWNFPAVWSF